MLGPPPIPLDDEDDEPADTWADRLTAAVLVGSALAGAVFGALAAYWGARKAQLEVIAAEIAIANQLEDDEGEANVQEEEA